LDVTDRTNAQGRVRDLIPRYPLERETISGQFQEGELAGKKQHQQPSPERSGRLTSAWDGAWITIHGATAC